MNIQLLKLKRAAILLAGISAILVPTMAHAVWPIIKLGDGQGFATGINDSGQVIGSISSSFSDISFITGTNGMGMTDLGVLDSSLGNEPSDINTFGQVVGFSVYRNSFDIHTTVMRAFITEPNGVGMIDMGTLGGNQSSANGINDSGQVVGWAGTANNETHAFITGSDGVGMTDLGTLGGNYSQAYAINDFGEVVGMSTTADGDVHAFIFSHGVMTDLSLLAPVVATGWSSLNVFDINNNGQIVGYGRDSPHSGPHPFLLLPIPEPETYTMLLAGLGLLGIVVRRRKQMRCS